jgi:hypothetical protein
LVGALDRAQRAGECLPPYFLRAMVLSNRLRLIGLRIASLLVSSRLLAQTCKITDFANDLTPPASGSGVAGGISTFEPASRGTLKDTAARVILA